MSHASGINPRWVQHTLTTRGIPLASLDAITYALSQMASKQSESFRSLVSRLHNGYDRDNDMDAMVEWSKGATAAWDAHQSAPYSADKTSPLVAAPPMHAPPIAPRSDVLNDPDREKLLHPERQKVRDSHHVYGSRASLCVEPALIEDASPGSKTPAFHTLLLELAEKRADASFDWGNKLTFRLTKRELPLFTAVLMGFTKSIDFENHGVEKNKAMTLDDQSAHLFLRVIEGKRLIPIQIPAEEVFYLASMAMQTLSKNSAGLDTQTVLMMVKRAAQMFEHQRP